jgi:hypothetical protein
MKIYFLYARISPFSFPLSYFELKSVFSFDLLFPLAELALTQPDYFSYLNQSTCFRVEGTHDAHDFQETLQGNKLYLKFKCKLDYEVLLLLVLKVSKQHYKNVL